MVFWKGVLPLEIFERRLFCNFRCSLPYIVLFVIGVLDGFFFYFFHNFVTFCLSFDIFSSSLQLLISILISFCFVESFFQLLGRIVCLIWGWYQVGSSVLHFRVSSFLQAKQKVLFISVNVSSLRICGSYSQLPVRGREIVEIFMLFWCEWQEMHYLK